MKRLIGWRLDGNKIILSLVNDDGSPDADIELPEDIYKEIIISGPPAEEQEIRAIINQIHGVIKKRVLMYDQVIGYILKNRERITKGLGKLESAGSKLEVSQWKAYLDGVSKDKANLQEFRHLIKAMYQDESKLRASLLRKLTK